ncbi:MAG: hypothetical protein P8184_20305, partial [Calditrichia bacterium]
METITYSLLKDGQVNSEVYYREAKALADEVLRESARSLGPVITEFMEYLCDYGLEEIREREEYLLELLSFGVLWRSYGEQALAVRHAPFITMARMAEWRKKHQRIKPVIDLVRGILITLFLLPAKSVGPQELHPDLQEIDHACKWFEATGEFREQALRFVRWRAFWANKNSEELTGIFAAIHDFTSWFEQRSVVVLGKYTENVDSFLQDSTKRYRWREDRVSCARTRLEYHLNMVGAVLMNRAFRAEFDGTDAKVVLVPGCLRGRPAEEC